MLKILKNKGHALNRLVIDGAKEALPVAIAAIRHAEESVPNSLRIEDGSASEGSHKLDAAVAYLNEHINIPWIPEGVEAILFRAALTVIVELGKMIWPKAEHGANAWLDGLEASVNAAAASQDTGGASQPA